MPLATLTLRTRVPPGTYVRKPRLTSARVGPAISCPKCIRGGRARTRHGPELLALQEEDGDARRRGALPKPSRQRRAWLRVQAAGSRNGVSNERASRARRRYQRRSAVSGGSDALRDRAECVAVLEHRRRAPLQDIPVRHVPAERVGEADDHVEERADRRGIAQGLVGDAGCAHRVGVGRRELLRVERQLLEEDERRLQLGTERRTAPVVDDRLPDLLTERVRRNCAV